MRFPGARSPITLTLLGYAALAIAVFLNAGARDDVGVVLVVLAIAAWGVAFGAAVARKERVAERSDRVAWLVALGSALLAFVLPPGHHVEGGLGAYHALSAVVVVLIASYAIDLRGPANAPAPTDGPLAAAVRARRALLFVLACALGVWMLKASPNPPIDTFPEHQQMAQAMLDGKSIYEPGVINVADTFKGTTVIRTYVYLPLSAYLTTLAFAVTHDIRWANLVAQLVGASLLWLAARRTSPAAGAAWADLLAASLLFHPRGLMVLEKAWTEPLALPFLGGFVVLAITPVGWRRVAASMCLGLLCAIKQHLVLYVPFLMLAPGIGFSGVAIAGAVAVATLVPYLVRGPLDMYRGVFGAIANAPFRDDALAIPAELSRIGVMVPTWVGFAGAVVPFAWLARVPRELGALLLGSCLVFGAFYVLGRQAFCNYYYLLDVTALFAAATFRPKAPRPA